MKGTSLAVSLVLLLLAGCATSHQLAEHDFRGAGFAAYVRTPPAPQISADYSFHIDAKNPIATAIRVGASLAKASEAHLAEERMLAALEEADVAGRLHGYIHEAAAEVLGCRTVDDADLADYILDLDVREYGLEAYSSGLSFEISLRIELVDRAHGEVIWRRGVHEEQPLTPELFGLHRALGDVITTVALSELTEEEMTEGFARLADRAAERVVRILEDDYLAARYR